MHRYCWCLKRAWIVVALLAVAAFFLCPRPWARTLHITVLDKNTVHIKCYEPYRVLFEETLSPEDAKLFTPHYRALLHNWNVKPKLLQNTPLLSAFAVEYTPHAILEMPEGTSISDAVQAGFEPMLNAYIQRIELRVPGREIKPALYLPLPMDEGPSGFGNYDEIDMHVSFDLYGQPFKQKKGQFAAGLCYPVRARDSFESVPLTAATAPLISEERVKPLLTILREKDLRTPEEILSAVPPRMRTAYVPAPFFEKETTWEDLVDNILLIREKGYPIAVIALNPPRPINSIRLSHPFIEVEEGTIGVNIGVGPNTPRPLALEDNIFEDESPSDDTALPDLNTAPKPVLPATRRRSP